MILVTLLFVNTVIYSQSSPKDSSSHNTFYELSILNYLKSSKYQSDSIYVESANNVTDSLPLHINGVRVLVVTKKDLEKKFRNRKTVRILRFEYPAFGKDFISIKLGVYDLSMIEKKYLYGKVEGCLFRINLPCLSGELKTEFRLTDQ